MFGIAITLRAAPEASPPGGRVSSIARSVRPTLDVPAMLSIGRPSSGDMRSALLVRPASFMGRSDVYWLGTAQEIVIWTSGKRAITPKLINTADNQIQLALNSATHQIPI